MTGLTPVGPGLLPEIAAVGRVAKVLVTIAGCRMAAVNSAAPSPQGDEIAIGGTQSQSKSSMARF